MGWYDSVIGGIADRYSGSGSGSSFDWSSLGGDTGSGGGGFWGSVVNWGSKLLGGGGGSSSSNIYSGILGGLNGAANAYISKEAVEQSGKESRKTLDFKAALEDYYAQKGKVRKRAALDTYGQFSTMDRWAPNATAAPPIDLPNKPGY